LASRQWLRDGQQARESTQGHDAAFLFGVGDVQLHEPHLAVVSFYRLDG